MQTEHIVKSKILKVKRKVIVGNIGIFIGVIPTLSFISSRAIYHFFYPFNDDKQLAIANSLAARNDI